MVEAKQVPVVPSHDEEGGEVRRDVLGGVLEVDVHADGHVASTLLD
jgi:hypothetical protein